MIKRTRKPPLKKISLLNQEEERLSKEFRALKGVPKWNKEAIMPMIVKTKMVMVLVLNLTSTLGFIVLVRVAQK
jgi:hypothetical protein